MEDRSGHVKAVAITFLFLTWLTVILRCYVRIFMVKGFGLDDQVMVVTLCFFTVYLACQIGGAVHGTGQHREALTDANAQIALSYWFLCEIFYTISTSMLKIAVGFFLLRITIVPYQVWVVRIIMVVSGIVGTIYTFLVIFQCDPISFWWDLDPTHTGTCLSPAFVTNFTYVVSGLNSFADWTFGILPILIVKDLQMKRRVKVVVSSVIALAAIGSTATIVRLPYTWTLHGYKGDFLWRTTDFAIWTTVEVGIGITAACMATLRPLMKSTIASFGSSPQSSGLPWSKDSRNKLGDHQRGQSLNVLSPAAKKAVTTTIITGGRVSSDSDEERFLRQGASSEGWTNGISKNVTTTIVEEHTQSKTAEYIHSKQAERIRRGSPGSDTGSTFAIDERGKPATVHNSF